MSGTHKGQSSRPSTPKGQRQPNPRVPSRSQGASKSETACDAALEQIERLRLAIAYQECIKRSEKTLEYLADHRNSRPCLNEELQTLLTSFKLVDATLSAAAGQIRQTKAAEKKYNSLPNSGSADLEPARQEYLTAFKSSSTRLSNAVADVRCLVSRSVLPNVLVEDTVEGGPLEAFGLKYHVPETYGSNLIMLRNAAINIVKRINSEQMHKSWLPEKNRLKIALESVDQRISQKQLITQVKKWQPKQRHEAENELWYGPAVEKDELEQAEKELNRQQSISQELAMSVFRSSGGAPFHFLSVLNRLEAIVLQCTCDKHVPPIARNRNASPHGHDRR